MTRTGVRIFIACLFFCVGVAHSQNMTRFVGDGEFFDLAFELIGDSARVFLAEKPTNAPLLDATVALQPSEGEPITFSASKAPGVYEATLSVSNLKDYQVVVEARGNADVIDLNPDSISSMPIAASANADVKADAKTAAPTSPTALQTQGKFHASTIWGALFCGFILGAILSFLYMRKRTTKNLTSSVFVFCLLPFANILFPKASLAHSGHAGHGEAPTGIESTVGVAIKIPKSSQFLLGVINVEAKREKIKTGFVSYGHIIAKPQFNADVAAPQNGLLYGVQNLVLGQKVRKGQGLGVVDAVGQIRLTSPLDGEILEILAIEGSRVDAGTKLFKITNTSLLWADAELFEEQLNKLPQISGVSVAVQGFSDGRKARLIKAMTGISEETRTAKVFVEIDNSDGKIRIGSFATIHFALRDEREAITLPLSAILNRSGEQIVYVQLGPESFESRSVVSEKSSEPGKIIITSGIKDGDRVVVKGNYQLLMKAK